MKILIVENEIYLAESLYNKLSSIGYECYMASTVREAVEFEDMDVVLLSSSLDDFMSVVTKFKNMVVILLASYVSFDSVEEPIRNGAYDYVLKPFIFDEIIRKIEHYSEYRDLKIINKTYKKYLNSEIDASKFMPKDIKNIKFPLLIRSNNQKIADHIAFHILNDMNLGFCVIDCNCENVMKILGSNCGAKAFYIKNCKDISNELVNLFGSRSVILSTPDLNFDTKFMCIDIKIKDKALLECEILTIDDYVRRVILTYQDYFPDTELSKKLGITRKSLWEKRHKYNILKQK